MNLGVALQRILGFKKPWPSVRPAYDGDNADFDGSGALTNQYLYGPGIDQLIARIEAVGAGSVSDGVDWYLTDILGSVRQLVQSDGTVIDEIAYDSFGQILSETNPSAGDRFKYTAHEWGVLRISRYIIKTMLDAATCVVLGSIKLLMPHVT